MSDDEEPPPEVNGSWDRLKGEDYLTPLHNKNAKALQLMIKDHEIPRTYWVTDGDHGNKLDHCLLARSRDAVAAWAEAQRAEDPHYMCPWEVTCVCVCTCDVCSLVGDVHLPRAHHTSTHTGMQTT